ncbi:sugar ABC transporter substrate-binding protein [Dictyobacter alpinus]|uniref:Sugar ABC transporter substrate-binding protein n=1 Tax=Dictyobacter alpinus TaxID=2014873 RepID=A0A402BAD3_9CHLR|nr:extracellular solute-binding protein [Dictyobacter alpinus]GCE28325.1 sugar ABC transporter substrate-binding protein [Dictyobacter alpinus]
MPDHFAFSKLKVVPLVLLAALLLGILSACDSSPSTSPGSGSTGSSTSGGPVTLTFWNWVAGVDKAAALYNKLHPDIHVNVVNVGGGANEYNKLYTAIKANNEPDMAQIEYQILPTFETTGALIDLSKYGANSLKSQFVPWTWNQVSLGNSVYAIPQDTGPLVLYYRADLFQKYNLPVPTTWAQYADDAVKLHAADPSAYITDFPARDPGWFNGLVWQAGGQMFSIDGQSWKVAVNNPQAQKVASYWQGLLSKKLIKTEPDFADAWYHDLGTGTLATWISAAWGAGTIKPNAPQTEGKWRVAPLPQWEEGQYANGNWGGSTTTVFNNTKHPKEAAEFAMWLNTNKQAVEEMIKGNAIYPASEANLDSPLVNGPQAFFGNQNVGAMFKSASEHVNATYQWGPTINQVYNDFGDNFAGAVNDQDTLPNGLNSVQQSTILFMQNQGFNVRS